MGAKLYVNKQNVISNLNSIKEKIGENTKIIAMVKANAYGTNAIQMVQLLKENGITDFGVAKISEGVSLREKYKEIKIIVTSSVVSEDDIQKAIENDLSISVSCIDIAKKINEIAIKNDKNINVHIAVNTGMTRLGINEEEVKKDVLYIHNKLKNINIEGIYTHLSCADTNEKFTKNQLNVFSNVVKELQNSGIKFEYIHSLNSDGVVRYDTLKYTHIRVGMIMYGYTNTKNVVQKKALKLVTNIIHINKIPKESKVSYGASYTANAGDKIAVIGIGYADGLFRCLSNNYYVKINGKKCKIVGNICMDMCMVDVSDIDDIKIGDEVIIFDFDDDLSEISRKCNTISYEIISRIGNRVEREFI